MSALGETLGARRKQLRQEKLFHYDVPEWGDVVDGEGGEKVTQPMRVYFRPWTLQEERLVRQQAKSNTEDMNAWAVVFKALDKDGKRLFDIGDVDWLLEHEDSRVVAGLCSAMDRAQLIEGEPLKNS